MVYNMKYNTLLKYSCRHLKWYIAHTFTCGT